MTEAEFVQTVRLNPVNAAILDRLPALGAPDAHLTASALFAAVWNVRSGRPATEGVRDYDVFYWDADLSWEAEDAVIRRAGALYADLNVRVEVRNQARGHVWFREKFGLERPAVRSARDGIVQFLVECCCVGLDQQGELYAPFGLDDLAAGMLRRNRLNPTPELYAAKVASYQERWPWLTQCGER